MELQLMHFPVFLAAVNAFPVRPGLALPRRHRYLLVNSPGTHPPQMDTSRRQGDSGYVDIRRRHAPSKRQAAAAVTDFVRRRAKSFRGERGPLAPPRPSVHRPPRGSVARGTALRGRGTTPYDGTMAGGEGGAAAIDAELPPPSVQLPMGTLHGSAVGMASFMASGGRERPATLVGSPAGGAKGADTAASVDPSRLGLSAASSAVSPVGGPQEPFVGSHRNGNSNPATDVSGGMPLAASLAATLFPPAAPSGAPVGVAVGGEVAARAGRRTSIFGHP